MLRLDSLLERWDSSKVAPCGLSGVPEEEIAARVALAMALG